MIEVSEKRLLVEPNRLCEVCQRGYFSSGKITRITIEAMKDPNFKLLCGNCRKL
jgi:hypothetical protein